MVAKKKEPQMTIAYPYPITVDYINSVLAKVKTRPDDAWWIAKYDSPFYEFGYRQKAKANIDNTLWWERCQEILDNGYEWPIPWDVSIYEALNQRGLWPTSDRVVAT